MKFRKLLLMFSIPALLLVGCSAPQEQKAVDDLTEKKSSVDRQESQPTQPVQDTQEDESEGQTAERVIAAYLEAGSAKGRSRYVLHPETTLPKMEKYYSGAVLGDIRADASSRIDGHGDPKVGKYGKYKMTYINQGAQYTSIYYVKNTRDGMKIDWESSVGYSDMSWNGFAGLRPTEPMTFRVNAQISSTYIFEFGEAGATHYSVNMAEGHFMFGYVKKNSRLGRRLFGILKDGERHHLTLKLRFLPERQQINCAVVIDDLVSEDWLIR